MRKEEKEINHPPSPISQKEAIAVSTKIKNQKEKKTQQYVGSQRWKSKQAKTFIKKQKQAGKNKKKKNKQANRQAKKQVGRQEENRP